MKELQGNKMDALISASLYRNVSKEAEAFMSLDVSGIKDNPRIKNRILNRAKNKRCASWISTLRIAAVACLIIISMVFTACMCIPEVRESMWNAFVEWYDDHISVHFTQNDDATEDVTEEEGASDIQKPPSSIEDNIVATYLPDGYYSEVSETSSMFTHILCYDAEGNMMFRLVQTVLCEADEDDILLDNENDPITTMYINGNEGILVEYPDVPGLYYLVWQDESYQYSLYGSFTSVSELMKIAEVLSSIFRKIVSEKMKYCAGKPGEGAAKLRLIAEEHMPTAVSRAAKPFILTLDNDGGICYLTLSLSR